MLTLHIILAQAPVIRY